MTTGRTDQRSVFVDTGAYAALAVTVGANHRRAVATASALEHQQAILFTPNFVVAEAYALMLARSDRDAAVGLLDQLDRSRDLIVRVSEEDGRRAREIVRRYRDKSFSLVDPMSFAVMERLGIRRAFTFDRHSRSMGSRSWRGRNDQSRRDAFATASR